MEDVVAALDRLAPSPRREAGRRRGRTGSSPGSTSGAIAARTSASRSRSRTVVRTRWPRRSSSITHQLPRNPDPPVTRTVFSAIAGRLSWRCQRGTGGASLTRVRRLAPIVARGPTLGLLQAAAIAAAAPTTLDQGFFVSLRAASDSTVNHIVVTYGPPKSRPIAAADVGQLPLRHRRDPQHHQPRGLRLHHRRRDPRLLPGRHLGRRTGSGDDIVARLAGGDDTFTATTVDRELRSQRRRRRRRPARERRAVTQPRLRDPAGNRLHRRLPLSGSRGTTT